MLVHDDCAGRDFDVWFDGEQNNAERKIFGVILPEPRRGWSGINVFTPNVEARMTNDEGSPDLRMPKISLHSALCLGFRHSFVIRH